MSEKYEKLLEKQNEKLREELETLHEMLDYAVEKLAHYKPTIFKDIREIICENPIIPVDIDIEVETTEIKTTKKRLGFQSFQFLMDKEKDTEVIEDFLHYLSVKTGHLGSLFRFPGFWKCYEQKQEIMDELRENRKKRHK